jgi:hypothetical protein
VEAESGATKAGVFKRDFKAPSKTAGAEQARVLFPRVISFQVTAVVVGGGSGRI